MRSSEKCNPSLRRGFVCAECFVSPIIGRPSIDSCRRSSFSLVLSQEISRSEYVVSDGLDILVLVCEDVDCVDGDVCSSIR